MGERGGEGGSHQQTPPMNHLPREVMDFFGSLTLLFIVLAVEINFRSTQTKKNTDLLVAQSGN